MTAPFGVVIVNWNSRDDLAECLRSLRGQTDRDFETVVVDNGSTDGSPAMVREQFGWAMLIEAQENLGFAEGCNRAVAASSAAWVATLNNDAVAANTWVATLKGVAARAAPRLGMVQCRILFRERPERTNSTGVLVFTDGRAIDRDYDAPARAGDVQEEIFCPSAGAAMYRRAMLDEVRLSSGYLDRGFFMYYEDVDLGWRCRLAGWDALYVPEAVVHHRFHGSAGRRGSHFVALQCHRNRLRYLVKNGSLPLLLRSAPRTLADLVHALRLGGPAELPSWYRSARAALRQRRELQPLLRVPRQELERRWLRTAR
ncbi:MAG: glycosyltransferase family 2 protein [Deltaproteobacteria bacterium]|nr:glycosyltransferase family 2 protein [Deltaproteobacteria bacterium]